MPPEPYQRVDWQRPNQPGSDAAVNPVDGRALDAHSSGSASSSAPPGAVGTSIVPGAGAGAGASTRWSVLVLCLALSLVQAVVTVLALHLYSIWLTASMIPIFAFALFFVLTALVNPLWAMTRLKLGLEFLPRAFSRIELTHLFAAMLVTAGISSYGLSQQVVPLIASPWNPDWNTPQRGWTDRLHPYLNENLYLTNPEASRQFFEGLTHDANGRAFDVPPASAPMGEHVAHQIAIARAIPWDQWVVPLAGWMVFIIAAYGLFYALTYLVIDHWITGEKLIFPLSRLGEALLPPGPRIDPHIGVSAVAASHDRSVPAFLTSIGFWLGFAISFGVQSLNAQQIPGLRIFLGSAAWDVNHILQGTALEGLTGRSNDSSLAFLVIFSAIGLAFLLSTEITFSVWFYYVLGKLFFLVAVWCGYGRNAGDFPANWLWFTNPITSQAGGALMLLSGLVMVRCIRDHLRGATAKPWPERLRQARPVVGLVVSATVLVAWLVWNRLPVLWASMLVVVTTLICLGLMRFVAEAGIYWFQVSTSFFHLYRILALGHWLPGVLLAPMVPIYSVLFLDVKCLLACNLVTAEAMRRQADDTNDRRSNRRYHLMLVLAIAVALVASILLTIHMAYAMGGNRLHAWLFRDGPKHFLDTSRTIADSTPLFDAANTAWFTAGAAWCGLSVWLRRTIFFFPHPIGYALLVSALTPHLWFSCFIGWACKKFVVRYGGKSTFDRVRWFFIGLIIGELVAIALWSLVSLITGVSFPTLDLNRYGT